MSVFHFHGFHLTRRLISTSISPPTESLLTHHANFKSMVSNGHYIQALTFYTYNLHSSPLHHNAFILPTLIKACSFLHFSKLGNQIWGNSIKSGLDSDPGISNSFISFYSKISGFELALKVFDNMPIRDTISWNSIVNCCIRNGYFVKGVGLFKEMYSCGFVAKAELIAAVMSVIGRGVLGRVIHGIVVVDERIEEDVFVFTSLVDWYFKCGDSTMGLRVFDRMKVKNEVSWTAVVAGCCVNFEYGKAIDYFLGMQINGVRPNRVTLITILPAIAEMGCFKHGGEIHGYAFRHGFDLDHHFSSSLIHFYCTCGEGLKPASAKLVFRRAKVKDVVMYSSVIRICSRSGDDIEALKLFNEMRAQGIKPNFITLLAVIKACSNLASFEHGIGSHGYIVKCGIDNDMDLSIGNALISMYSKCGCLADSHQIFKEMHTRDSVSWSTLIAGYGLHGYGEEALCLFHEMQAKGLEVDGITVLGVLSACNHAGLVKEGQRIFNDIKKEGKIPLSGEHYACQIDLLGKSGKINDALDTLQTMPMKPSTKIWSSLVSACKTHGYLEIAEMLVQNVIKSEPSNAANHTSLSMVYAESGNWCGVEEVRRLMRAQGLNKCDGVSTIATAY
ncbi:Tetratricopeptide repeat (TPR)-like superfamily protein [Euphorbia peplus]|nr:Tetratricopeptide repeat (TPR)-like superfamily protein [Euphorbia peplus]